MAERGSLSAVDLTVTVDDLGVVQEELYEARTHWYNIGLKLKVKVDVLNSIRSEWSSPKECFREMLMGYLQTVAPSPSWKSLIEALRSPTVDQPQLAEKMEQKYCPAPTCIETKDNSSPLPQKHDEPLPNALEDAMPLCSPESEDSQPSSTQKHNESLPHAEANSMPLSPVSEKRPETSTEDALHALALRISTSGEVSTDEEQQPKDFGCGCGKCSFYSFLEKGCPEPVQSMSSFPYLNTDGLSHSQKQILRGKLYHEFEVITTDFSSLVYNTCESLLQQGVTVRKLVLLLMTLDAFQPTLPNRPLLEEHIEELKVADSIYDVFFILRGYMSFFSFHIIDHIIRKFGTQKNNENLQNYDTKLDEYSRRSVFECPTYSLRRKDQANLIVKVEGVNLEIYTAKHLEVFQSRISNIIKVSKYTLRLCTVEKGCLQLTFQMPCFVKEVIFSISASQKAALQGEGVTRLTCDGYQCPLKQSMEEAQLTFFSFNQLASDGQQSAPSVIEFFPVTLVKNRSAQEIGHSGQYLLSIRDKDIILHWRMGAIAYHWPKKSIVKLFINPDREGYLMLHAGRHSSQPQQEFELMTDSKIAYQILKVWNKVSSFLSTGSKDDKPRLATKKSVSRLFRTKKSSSVKQKTDVDCLRRADSMPRSQSVIGNSVPRTLDILPVEAKSRKSLTELWGDFSEDSGRGSLSQDALTPPPNLLSSRYSASPPPLPPRPHDPDYAYIDEKKVKGPKNQGHSANKKKERVRPPSPSIDEQLKEIERSIKREKAKKHAAAADAEKRRAHAIHPSLFSANRQINSFTSKLPLGPKLAFVSLDSEDYIHPLPSRSSVSAVETDFHSPTSSLSFTDHYSLPPLPPRSPLNERLSCQSSSSSRCPRCRSKRAKSSIGKTISVNDHKRRSSPHTQDSPKGSLLDLNKTLSVPEDSLYQRLQPKHSQECRESPPPSQLDDQIQLQLEQLNTFVQTLEYLEQKISRQPKS